MSAQSIPRLYTVEDCAATKDPPGGRYELHHGELVFVPFPYRCHIDLQRRLRELLTGPAEARGYVVDTVYPYRPLPESESWGGGRGVHQQRSGGRHRPGWVADRLARNGIEAGLVDRAMTTLAGDGSLEFWVADPNCSSVKVYSKSAGVRIYQGSAEVPVPALDTRISLDAIFGE